jgi:hypothetical protein
MNMLNASAGFQPTQKLHSSVSFGYSDNLTGTLLQSILPTSGSAVQAGDQPIAQKFNQSSNSLYVDGVSTYQVNRSLLVDVDVQRRQQSYLGTNYGVNMYGGGANYVHGVLGGFFGASLNVSAITSDFHTGHVMSFSTNANYSRGIGQWTLTGGFGYAQNVQALLVTYMSSYYTYSGSVRRRLFDGLLTWGGSAAGSRTALSQDPHTGNSNQSYTTSIGLPHYTATAAYAKSDGFGLLGGNGLVQPPNVPPGTIPPEWLILYGGHSYSFGLGATPIRKLSIGANFSRAWSDTSTGGIGSWNHVDQGNANLNYQVRKLMFTASYGRIFQGFSASGIPPSNINSFYVGFSRSFNLF